MINNRRKVSLPIDPVDRDYSRTSSMKSSATSKILTVPLSNIDDYNEKYAPLFYVSNYVSGLEGTEGSSESERHKLENEVALKNYYASKIHALSSGRNNSMASSDQAPKRSGRDTRLKGSLLSRQFSFPAHVSTSERINFNAPTYSIEKTTLENIKAYRKYYEKLKMHDSSLDASMARHKIWLPVLRWQFVAGQGETSEDRLSQTKTASMPHVFTSASLPSLDKDSLEVSLIAKDEGVFSGTSTHPQLFGNIKLPSFAYQCTVESKDIIYIIGGLIPSYSFNEEAPDLKDFYVDGIKNLPPPIKPGVVNNPGMVNNSELYVFSSKSNYIRKPRITGHIPPPLLCMTGSKLTERHIFYYGGLEIRTETLFDEDTGKFYLKKRAFLNNTGYILDTMTYKFSKVELVAQPTEFTAYPSTVPRFGHSQVSVKFKSQNSTESGKCLVCGSLDSEFNNADEVKSSSPSAASYQQMEDMKYPSTTTFTSDNNILEKISTSYINGVYTIFIMGGYRQMGADDDYETLRDIWKVEVPVISRGKRNYFKFADTALATMLPGVPDNAECETWPRRRAFHACNIYNTNILKKGISGKNLLDDLQTHFELDPMINERALADTYPIFPNIPHSTHHNQQNNHHIHQRYTHSNYAQAPYKEANGSKKKSEKDRSIGKTLVIHGGSDKDHVYGDMWWFDLDTETWTHVDTYCQEEKDGGFIPIEFTLVGHTLIQLGKNAVCIGGLSQEDVNDFLGVKNRKNESKGAFNNSGSKLFKVIDLKTQTLKDYIFCPEEQNVHRTNSNKLLDKVRTTSMSAVSTSDGVFLIGGLVAKEGKVEEVYLRGAVGLCVIPTISMLN